MAIELCFRLLFCISSMYSDTRAGVRKENFRSWNLSYVYYCVFYYFLYLQLGYYAWMLYSLFCLERNVVSFHMRPSHMHILGLSVFLFYVFLTLELCGGDYFFSIYAVCHVMGILF